MKKQLVINFFGGPGVAKSTMAADVFAELKWNNINCELSREVAKDYVWAGQESVLDNQLGVFGEQQKLMYNLNGKVDVIITDSPLLLSVVYGAKDDLNFRTVILNEFNKYDNINFLLERVKPFNPKGRIHDEEQSKELDKNIKAVMDYHKVPYTFIKGEKESVIPVTGKILRILESRKDV